jgi:hypothetical protein
MQFITLLPTSYNDGQRVPDEEMQATLAELFGRFGRASVSGPVHGYWVDERGQRFTDESLRVEIATPREKLTEVHEVLQQIGRRLRQETMYLEIRDYDGVQVVPIAESD